MPGSNGEPIGNFSTDQTDGDGIYTHYSCVTSYQRNEGLLQVPVAGPPDTPAVLLRTSAPYSAKVVSWTAVREGGPPRIPDPTRFDPNAPLIDSQIGVATPMLMVNGTDQRWCLAGVYYYAYLSPRKANDPLPSGKMPVDTVAASANTLQSGQFDGTLMPLDGS